MRKFLKIAFSLWVAAMEAKFIIEASLPIQIMNSIHRVGRDWHSFGMGENIWNLFNVVMIVVLFLLFITAMGCLILLPWYPCWRHKTDDSDNEETSE